MNICLSLINSFLMIYFISPKIIKFTSLSSFKYFIISVLSLSKGFYAAPGWDPTSGIGSVDYRKLKDYFYSLHSGPVRYSVKQVKISNINKTDDHSNDVFANMTLPIMQICLTLF